VNDRHPRRLFFAHPAVIDPDDKQTKNTGGEIAGWSVKIKYPGFNDTKTQDVGIFLASK
jgi:hypothetical protein